MSQATDLRTDVINTLAMQAAEAAVDMASEELELLPTALVALDFISNARYESETDEELIVLTRREVTNFRHAYCRQLRNLKIPVDTAVSRSFE